MLPRDERIFVKHEHILIIDSNTIRFNDLGYLLATMNKHPGDNILVEEYEYLNDLDSVDIVREVLYYVELVDDIILPEYQKKVTQAEIEYATPGCEFLKSVTVDKDVSWYVLTNPDSYKAVSNEVVIRGPIDMDSIKYIVDTYQITGFAVADIDLMLQLMKIYHSKVFFFPRLRKLYSDDLMIQLKRDSEITHLEVANRHELITYIMYKFPDVPTEG